MTSARRSSTGSTTCPPRRRPCRPPGHGRRAHARAAARATARGRTPRGSAARCAQRGRPTCGRRRPRSRPSRSGRSPGARRGRRLAPGGKERLPSASDARPMAQRSPPEGKVLPPPPGRSGVGVGGWVSDSRSGGLESSAPRSRRGGRGAWARRASVTCSGSTPDVRNDALTTTSAMLFSVFTATVLPASWRTSRTGLSLAPMSAAGASGRRATSARHAGRHLHVESGRAAAAPPPGVPLPPPHAAIAGAPSVATAVIRMVCRVSEPPPAACSKFRPRPADLTPCRP